MAEWELVDRASWSNILDIFSGLHNQEINPGAGKLFLAYAPCKKFLVLILLFHLKSIWPATIPYTQRQTDKGTTLPTHTVVYDMRLPE